MFKSSNILIFSINLCMKYEYYVLKVLLQIVFFNVVLLEVFT